MAVAQCRPCEIGAYGADSRLVNTVCPYSIAPFKPPLRIAQMRAIQDRHRGPDDKPAFGTPMLQH